MRVRDHIAVSTVGAALLYPFVGRRVVGALAASILIDVDHYLWFVLRRRNVNPVSAVRFFNDGSAPQDATTRVLHSPIALSLVALLAARRRSVLPVAIGMAVHVAMDTYHEAQMGRARDAVLRRDNFTCQVCGSREALTAHLKRQPRLLPSYGTQNLITLCGSCHDAAHRRVRPPARESAGVAAGT